jgi:hypothetical protein
VDNSTLQQHEVLAPDRNGFGAHLVILSRRCFRA